MADIRLERQGITSTNIPKVDFSTSQISGLEKIAISTANDAKKFQDTSEKLYLANFEKEARQAISEIAERNKSNPEQLKKDLIESHKGFSKNTPFQLRGVVEAQYEIMGRPMINNALKMRTKINNDELLEASLSNITESFKNLEMSSVGMLSNDEHVAFDASRSAQLQMNTITSMVNQTGEDGLPLLSAAQRVSFLEKAKQSVVSAGIKGDFDSSTDKIQTYKDFISGKKIFKFYDEEGNIVREIDPLFEMNRGTFEKTRNYMESEIKSILKQQATVQSIANFQQKFDDNNLLIDPKNKEDRKQVDTHFDNVEAPKLENLSPEDRNNEIVNYIDRVGILPKTVSGRLRATMRNGSLDNQIASADLISKLQEVNPQSLNELDGTDVAYSLSLTSALRGGLEPTEAFAQTKEIFNPLAEDVRKTLKVEFNALEISPKKDFNQEFGTSWWSKLFNNEADLSKSALGVKQAEEDYLNEYQRQFILNGGNQEDAKARALTVIGRNYGPTGVTGSDRIVKYPPENYYGVAGLSNEWMTNQVQQQVNNITERDVDMDDIAVVADIQTAREIHNNTEPRYSIMLKNDNGAYEPIIKNGLVMRMKFDATEAVRKKNEEWEKERQENIDEQMLIQTNKRLSAIARTTSTQPTLEAFSINEEVDTFEDVDVQSLLGGS